MGFVSFAGRVLFASVFLLSAYQEFNDYGVDGGPAAKALRPKYNTVINHVTSDLDTIIPEIEMKHVITATIVLKGFGGLVFIFSSSFGASLLLLYLAIITPVVYDFYNYEIETPEFCPTFHQIYTELGSLRCTAIFPGDEELNSKEAGQVERSQSKDNQSISKVHVLS